MNDTACFLKAVAEYCAAELAYGRIMPPFEEWNTSDRDAVLARAQFYKERAARAAWLRAGQKGDETAQDANASAHTTRGH